MNFNPWVSIWLKPRATMKEVFERKPKHTFLLIYIGTISTTLNRASTSYIGDDFATNMVSILTLCLFLTIIGALITYFIAPSILRWVGTWLGGEGDNTRIRYALSHSLIPSIYILVFTWIPMLFLFGIENFTLLTPKIDNDPVLLMTLLFFGFIQITLGIWEFIIFLKCFGEALQFSAWKSLLTVIIIFVALMVLIFLFGLFITTISFI
ncbi:Yip1 family protein [Chengkuizengella sediminis]|uniref:Yip1 family protein n=1 Tax=Chengkuizengella sediminis TaxID=1885917 RepID=UPI001389D36C|nr:Yip1 family protein [Chengkuizengella sediminis]NDI35516.1 YIP1 family protein [Chengkuizengella sediminis]